jgi:DNA polymerase III subunit chi
MPDVSFYILASESLQERYLFACRLIEKAYRSGHFCYVLTDNAEQSQKMDDLLWTFRAGSFIPHQLYTGELPDIARDDVHAASSPGASAAIEKVILIGSLDAPEHWQKTIINLSSTCPHASDQTERILEILDNSEATKVSGRQRYRHYQQSGINVTIHKINQGS